MRKILITILLLVVAIVANAGSDVNLIGGSFEFMREVDTNMLFEIDYSKTTVEGKTLQQYLKSRGDDFVKDWPSDCKKAYEYFTTRFNKKSKGIKICESKDSKPKYKMVMHVKTFDMGNGGSSFIPMASSKAGGVIANVVIDVAEYPSGKAVAKITLPETKGNGHVSEVVRIGMCYFEIATALVKEGKKNDNILPIKNSDINVGLSTTKSSKSKGVSKNVKNKNSNTKKRR